MEYTLNIRRYLKMGLILIFSLAIIITYSACGKKEIKSLNRGQNYYFDTVCTIDIYDLKTVKVETKEQRAKTLMAEVFSICQKLENTLSKTKENSDVWNINNAHAGEKIQVSNDTATIVKEAMKLGEKHSEFDITLGSVIDLWDFHSEKNIVPSSDEVGMRLMHSGLNKLHLETEGESIFLWKEDDALKIDLGGIAKGYIADYISNYLREKGVTAALINLGGNIETIGEKGKDTPFKIGIEKPFSDKQQVVGYTNLKDATIVTSGIYERYFEKDGKIYHHILDSKTGYPKESNVVSVTVMGPKGSSMKCDALATTSFLMGDVKGMKMLEEQKQIEAMMILKNGKIKKTSGFKLK